MASKCFVFNSCVFLLISSYHIDTVDAIWCHCTARRECERNNTCNALTGRCATINIRKDGGSIYEYRCFLPDELYPPYNPMVCHDVRFTAHLFTVKCCNSEDFCNKKEMNHPTLAPIPTSPSPEKVRRRSRHRRLSRDRTAERGGA
jgi:hypothetical protein